MMKKLSKEFVLLITIIATVNCCLAQTSPQSPDFAFRFGANSSNYGQAVWGVKLDNSGNTYATGNFNGTTNFNPLGTTRNLTAYSNFQDGFLAKYNSSGIAQWVIPFTSQSASTSVANSNGGVAVTTDASGNVYITGAYWGTVDFNPSSTATRNLTSNGNADIFIAKYNSNGEYQWAYSIGGSGADVGTKIAIDNSGNVYLAIRFNGSSIETNTTSSGASKILTAAGPADIAIIKYNASGVFQDAIAVSSASNNEIVNDMQVDGNNNLFCVGTYSGTLTCGGLSITSAGFGDAFVLKLNSSLVSQKFISVGGISSDEGKNIAIDANNDVVVSGLVASGTAGYSINMNNTGGSPSNITIINAGREAFISKYDNNGDFKWATITQGTAISRIPRLMGLGIDRCNNIMLSGAYVGAFDFDLTGPGGSFTVPSTEWAGINVKFNASGQYSWGYMISGASVNFYAFDYNSSLNKYAVGGDMRTTTAFPNVDADPTSGTLNLQSFNSNYQAALLCVYPDPGNVIPTITFGSVNDVSTTSTNFNLPYSATTGSPDQYSISTITPTAMPNFTAISNATLSNSPISVTIPQSTVNTYNFTASVRNSTTGCVSANTNFTLNIIPYSTTWNGTSWSNGTPTSALDAIIASNTAPGSFTCKALTVNNGITLNVSNGSTVTVSSSTTNNGNIVVAPTGNFVSAAAVSNVTIQKSIIGQRGWRMFAYPFTTTQTFSSLATTNGIAISTTPSGASGLTDVRSFTNGTTNGWNNVIASSTTANTPFALFIRGLASEVTGLNYNAGPSAFTFSVNGTLNASPFSITPSASNFTLVGNPFAAPVNSSALTNGTGKSYYVYQISQGGNLTAQRTKAGAWSTVLSSSATTPIPTLGVIAYQAGSASSYTVSTSDINTTNAATTGLFSTEKAIEHLELRVLQNGMQLDNLFVRQDAASSEKGTDGKDLQKLANEGLNFYTLTTADNHRLAVDARNLVETTTIPLGIVGAVGNYQLQVANLNIEGVNVSLKDAFTGTTTPLKNSSNYDFTITTDAASKGENRFELVLNKAASNIAGVDVLNAGKMTAKLLNGNINKSSVAQLEIAGAAGKVEIRVTDMAGRLLHTQAGQNGRNTIQLGRKAGVQLITISDGTTTINQKMVKQ